MWSDGDCLDPGKLPPGRKSRLVSEVLLDSNEAVSGLCLVSSQEKGASAFLLLLLLSVSLHHSLVRRTPLLACPMASTCCLTGRPAPTGPVPGTGPSLGGGPGPGIPTPLRGRHAGHAPPLPRAAPPHPRPPRTPPSRRAIFCASMSWRVPTRRPPTGERGSWLSSGTLPGSCTGELTRSGSLPPSWQVLDQPVLRAQQRGAGLLQGCQGAGLRKHT